jgi:hypothetical protein
MCIEPDNLMILRLTGILKILVQMTLSDASNVEYLLNMGLNEFLIGLLQWNNPSNIINFSVPIDIIINKIILNLVNSMVQDFGNKLIDGG